MAEPLDLAAVRARAVAARELITRLKLAGNITDVGGAEALYIVVGDLEATLSRLESVDRLHRDDHARVEELAAIVRAFVADRTGDTPLSYGEWGELILRARRALDAIGTTPADGTGGSTDG